MQFGALRVVNDDLVKPRAGFGTHPHRHAEIFSYVLEGQLSHQDSMGSRESLSRGAVQYMSAGRGVLHSEMNDHGEVCRFIQVWITPDRAAPTYGTPKYGSAHYTKQDRHNKLLHILSGTGLSPAWSNVNSSGVTQLHQDSNVFVSESDAGQEYELELAARRQAYVLCMEGSLQVNGDQLQMRDAAAVKAADDAPSLLTLSTGSTGSHFMIIEMAKSDD